MKSLLNHSFLSMLDYTPEEFAYYLDLAEKLKQDKAAGKEIKTLNGKNFALIFEKDSPAPGVPSKWQPMTRVLSPPTWGPQAPRLARRNPLPTPPGYWEACSTPLNSGVCPERGGRAFRQSRRSRMERSYGL